MRSQVPWQPVSEPGMLDVILLFHLLVTAGAFTGAQSGHDAAACRGYTEMTQQHAGRRLEELTGRRGRSRRRCHPLGPGTRSRWSPCSRHRTRAPSPPRDCLREPSLYVLSTVHPGLDVDHSALQFAGSECCSVCAARDRCCARPGPKCIERNAACMQNTGREPRAHRCRRSKGCWRRSTGLGGPRCPTAAGSHSGRDHCSRRHTEASDNRTTLNVFKHRGNKQVLTDEGRANAEHGLRRNQSSWGQANTSK